MTKSKSPRLSRRLLRWYDRNRRILPWRALPGTAADPYCVWLSEIMLQQTTVATVIPYFGKFVAKWPSVNELAHSDLDEVLHAWQGLGYYARARNMHRCAGVVSSQMGGVFPDTEAELRRLPGIGPYTAAAIAAIAFRRRTAPVDGNIERVLSRINGIEEPVRQVKDRIRDLMATQVSPSRPGDFVQAMMDLGATVCRPKSPDCPACPLAAGCVARASGQPQDYPGKAVKTARPTRRGVVFWAVRDDGAVLLRRRPETGLLGGLMEFPSTDWRERAWSPAEACPSAPAEAQWRPVPGTIGHTFTHFHLELCVLTAPVGQDADCDGIWSRPADFANHALPTVMKKVARHVLTGSDHSS